MRPPASRSRCTAGVVATRAEGVVAVAQGMCRSSAPARASAFSEMSASTSRSSSCSKIVSVSGAGATESAFSCPCSLGQDQTDQSICSWPDVEQLPIWSCCCRRCPAALHGRALLWSCSGCCGVCEAQEWPPVRLSAGAAGWPTHGFRSRALQAAAPQLIFRVKTLRDRVERALNFELVLWV